MKKFIGVFLLALLTAFLALPAAADEVLHLLTAEITLTDMERLGSDHFLTLTLPDGDDLVVYAVEHCRYLDGKGNALSPEAFFKSYQGRNISVDFLESKSDLPEYEHIVLECRGR